MHLTALNIEVTHGRVKWKYWKISLTVKNEMTPHSVEHRPIAKDPQINIIWIDVLLKGQITFEI